MGWRSSRSSRPPGEARPRVRRAAIRPRDDTEVLADPTPVPENRTLRRDWPVGLAFLLLVIVAYADPLFTHRTFIGRDLLPYNIPLEKAVHDAWSRGRVPVWWDAISGGRPLLPNPNAGVFYPVRMALAGVAFPEAMRLFPIVHWILGGWGMLALMRVCGGSRAAAWVAAASFAFSGVLVSEVFYFNFLPGAALLPWSLWALARRPPRRLPRIVPVALVYGLMLLAGDAFSLVIAASSAVLWILLETAREERAGRALELLAGLVVAALLALPQIVATGLVAPETRRMISGFRLQEVLTFSVRPARLLELVVPFPFGPAWSMDLSLDWGAAAFRRFFTTLFVGPIALIGILRTFPGSPRGARFARVLAVGGIALAVAGSFVPDAWGSLTSPIPLRYPEKFMLAAAFGLALAAGIAVDGLRRGRAGISAIVGVAAALALAAVAARLAPEAAGRFVAAAAGAPAGDRMRVGLGLPGALSEAGLLWMATALGIALLRGDRLPRLAGALALLTLVPVASNRKIAQSAGDDAVFPPTPFARVVAKRDPGRVYRELDESLYQTTALRGPSERGDWGGTSHYRSTWIYYTQSLWGRGTVLNGDLDAGDFSRLWSLREVSYLAALRSDSAPFFSALALRYGSRYRDQDPIAGFRPFGGDAFRVWDENPDAQPRIRLLERWREEVGPVRALSAIPRLSPAEIVIETARGGTGSARPGRVLVESESPEAFSLWTESPDPTWLFVLRGDWEYRSVLLDGRPAAVFPAQLAFSAVPIPAGTHRVEWRERAPGLEISLLGPLAALVIVGVSLARKAP